MRPYGWAAPVFNDRPPQFGGLQERVGLADWRGYYRMASHGTHANPMGVTWNIQDLADTNMAWAGPSNAGLVDPAQCSLIAPHGRHGGIVGLRDRRTARSSGS